MSSDYTAIRMENERRYGTDIARIGPMLLANRYDDRTHFIFELLQNAEDALAHREGWTGSRAVRFDLREETLHFSHFGKLFDNRDVRGICGIAESTKDKTEIGRFGIGFKSVYAYTDRPEIHSGGESFAIENFVWPTSVPAINKLPDETIISLPLNAGVPHSAEEITHGLQRLGPAVLLFLREIEEIEWNVGDELSGIYLRSKPESWGPGVRRITVIGQQVGVEEVEESWLIFFRDVATNDGMGVGQVEVAFSITDGKQSPKVSIQPVSNSPLVVFFPTVVLTQLGFLVQGPYRTTPSRDNVPKGDPWNQYLVRETAELLCDALSWMRDQDFLDVPSLRCLPLERSRFPENGMFAPIFEAVRTKLASESLLPSSGGGYISAKNARMARTQDLRALFTPGQLRQLFNYPEDLEWVSGDISQDRTPDVRQYLMQELGIIEVTPEMLIPRLSKEFLESQGDAWIQKLYEFLRTQSALIRSGRLRTIPLIRLRDGQHVSVTEQGRVQAFLPSMIETSFPTVRESVCESQEARQFLVALGLTEPDPVDDVVWNILPKYHRADSSVTDDVYSADIRRILDAYRTDSKGQREKLLTSLRESCFVKSVAPYDDSIHTRRPGDVYLATAKLKDLLSGVKEVLLVDDRIECLRGEEIRDLLEACGSARTLLPIPVERSLTHEEKLDLRVAAGCEKSSGGERITDFDLRGLDRILELFPDIEEESHSRRAELLWEALGDIEDRRGAGVFSGKYEWTFYNRRSISFDSTFVRKLNNTAWVPTADGALHCPHEVVFETLGWSPDPFLESKILFKPPIIEQLAKEAGIDPGLLDLLKRLGVTSEEELRRRLGIEADSSKDQETNEEPTLDGVPSPDPLSTLPALGTSRGDSPEKNRGDGHDQSGRSDRKSGNEGGKVGSEKETASDDKKRTEGTLPTHARPFISYIAADPAEDGHEHDPDGLDRDARMLLEAKAIELILRTEPDLKRTQTNNPGFDLFEPGDHGRPIRWVEVKAMTSSLQDRPVCLSRTQFDCAWVNGEAYWLYIVEHADDESKANILRINDPAGKAKNFTFDRGWRSVVV